MKIAAPNLRSHVPAGFQSPWYKWFVDLGYPNLDILREGESYWKDIEETGEWHIIEFYRSPVIPCMTPWNYVLQGIRNTEISRAFVEKYVAKLDLRRKQVWDESEAKTAAMEEEQAALDRHREATADEAVKILKKNDALMDRIWKNGVHEMNPDKIWKHVPRHQKIGSKINKRGFNL